MVYFSFLAVTAAPGFSQEPVTINALLDMAKQNNAEIIAARERMRAAGARVAGERTWDKPRLTLEWWDIPEGTFDLSGAAQKMYGISQSVPFPGKLGARGAVAGAEAEIAQWEYRRVEQDVVSRLKSEYAAYYYLVKSIETLRKTSGIMNDLGKVAEAKYMTGKASQGELLRAQIEAEKMSAEAVNLDSERDSSAASINRLLGKSEDAVLGDPEELNSFNETVSWDEIKALVLNNNPEFKIAQAMELKAKRERRSARLEYLPDFDITYRRKTLNGQWAGSDFMFGFDVPLWFSKQGSLVRETRHSREAAGALGADAGFAAVAGAKEAFIKLGNSKRMAELYNKSVLPKSEQALNVTRSGYDAGKAGFLELMENVKSYLQLRLEYYGYVSDYVKGLAALEKAAGANVQKGAGK